jgi:hypothetical protein
VREALCIFGAGPDAPDVVALQLVEAKVLDERPGGRDPLPVRAAREVRIEGAVVVDHHHAVARHADIELQRGDPDGERALEARQRVLRGMAARAAVALKVERVQRRRSGHGDEENGA